MTPNRIVRGKLTGDSVEVELATISARLSHLNKLLSSKHHPALAMNDRELPECSGIGEFGPTDDSPFQLLGNSSMMSVLGLGANFAQDLIRVERSTPHVGDGRREPRLLIIHHQQAEK